MGTFSLIWRIATGPVWLLWTGYKGLWWVFGDTHERTPKAVAKKPAAGVEGGAGEVKAGVTPDLKADQASSFEVVDSSPKPIAPPISRLRAGFIGTMLSSAGLLLATNAMGASGAVAPERAFVAWLWGTALTAVVSILVVKRSARKAREKRGVTAVLRSVREAGAKAAAGAAVGAAAGCKWAAASIRNGAERAEELNARHDVSGKMKRSVAGACSAARRAWGSIGRPSPESRTAA